MNNEKNKFSVPLFSKRDEPKDYKTYIYGSEPDEDTFGKALKRYADEIGITQAQLAELTGISRSSFYSYYNDRRNIGYEYLIIVCVALRLHPMRQEYLFSFTSHKIRRSDPRYFTIKSFLANCAFVENYTVEALCEKLKAENKEPLISKKRTSGDE